MKNAVTIIIIPPEGLEKDNDIMRQTAIPVREGDFKGSCAYKTKFEKFPY